MSATDLTPRQRRHYACLALQGGALLHVVRVARPGPLGPSTIATCNAVIALANRVFAREPGYMRLLPIDPGGVFTQSDLVALTNLLTLSSLAFEANHAADAIPPEPAIWTDPISRGTPG